jgi:hypothetical protein
MNLVHGVVIAALALAGLLTVGLVIRRAIRTATRTAIEDEKFMRYLRDPNRDNDRDDLGENR